VRKDTEKRREMLPSWKDWKRAVKEAKEKSEPLQESPVAVAEPPTPKEPLARLNEASEEQLSKIKGVGPKRLKQIVALRPFANEGHLKKELPLIAKKLIEWSNDE
jgi:DNA uptake protein ComE-like DNA-binding protein